MARRRSKHHKRETGDPYVEGFETFVAGKPIEKNPYVPDSVEYKQWREGWLVAQEDAAALPLD